MGCGTGENIRANECFRIRLGFGQPIPPQKSIIYSRFETSVRWALGDQLCDISPRKSGVDIMGVEITVRGPINTTLLRREFARGMNSLARSVRITTYGEPTGNWLFVTTRQRLPGGQIQDGPSPEFDNARARRRRYKKKRAGKARARTGGR
jgi:hypothetical protein